MKDIIWSTDKNEWLKKNRKISFELVSEMVRRDEVIDVIDNPNRLKYPGQKIYILSIRDYIFEVPFVENSDYIFLKTIYPSRKSNKIYSLNK